MMLKSKLGKVFLKECDQRIKTWIQKTKKYLWSIFTKKDYLKIVLKLNLERKQLYLRAQKIRKQAEFFINAATGLGILSYSALFFRNE